MWGFFFMSLELFNDSEYGMPIEDRPLADRMRPKNLEEVYGQNHVLNQGGLLRNLIENDKT